VGSKQGEEAVVVGRRPALELLRAGTGAQRILMARGLPPSGILGEIRRRAQTAGVPVRFVPSAEIDARAAGMNHQGVLVETARYRYTPLARVLERDLAALLFLDGITDPHNLGSLLRSADGAGFDGIVVRSHRSVGVTATVRRVASGAAEVVSVARVTNLARALDDARGAGLWIVGLHANASGNLWTNELLQRPIGIVLGAEGKGISRSVEARCDTLVRIPLAGRLASLNVAVAGAVAMFEVARRSLINP
jgi:23S rRNA (guanosine2251-2'-O)-methyltransferase